MADQKHDVTTEHAFYLIVSMTSSICLNILTIEMSFHIPESLLKCIATTYNLIAADGHGQHQTKLTNIDHLCGLVCGEETWKDMKAHCQAILCLTSERTTAFERMSFGVEEYNLEELKQQRGIDAFDRMIKIGLAFDTISKQTKTIYT